MGGEADARLDERVWAGASISGVRRFMAPGESKQVSPAGAAILSGNTLEK
jgi:hypothetical protein